MNKFTHEYRKYLLRPIPDRKLSPSERADRKELYLNAQAAAEFIRAYMEGL